MTGSDTTTTHLDQVPEHEIREDRKYGMSDDEIVTKAEHTRQRLTAGRMAQPRRYRARCTCASGQFGGVCTCC